jgi:hypothetical protein
MRTKAWTKRDFSDVFNGTTKGITAVGLVGAQSYVTGETYQNALDKIAVSAADATDSGTAGDVTIRYGDVLTDTSTSYSGDWSDVSCDAGGQDFSLAAGTFDADFTENDILVVADGSNNTNISYGKHYYTVYDVSGNGFSIKTRGRDTGIDYGIADSSTNVPSFCSGADVWLLTDPSGPTYRQTVEEFLTGEKMHIGDTDGFVYYFDEDGTSYSGTAIDQEHLTPIIDLQIPDIHKRWTGISVTAKGDAMKVGYRISDFTGSTWTEFTQTLTSDYEEYPFYINETSKRIQFGFFDFSGGDIQIREYKIMDPEILDDR